MPIEFNSLDEMIWEIERRACELGYRNPVKHPVPIETQKEIDSKADANATVMQDAWGVDIRLHGASVNNSDNSSEIEAADDHASAANKSIIIPPGTFIVDDNLTIDSNVVFCPGAVLSITATHTLTVSGDIVAGTSQIFAGAGSVSIASQQIFNNRWNNTGNNIRIIESMQLDRLGVGTAAHATNITTLLATDTTANSKALNVSHTGAITGSGYAVYAAKSGASTTNIAAYLAASGATNNYALITSGRTGMNKTTPQCDLDILGTATPILNLDYPASATTYCQTGRFSAWAVLDSPADGIGAFNTFSITTDQSTYSNLAAMGAKRSGANNTGSIYLQTFNAGNLVDALIITNLAYTGINTTTPRRTLDVLNASDPQARLSYSDNSVFTDLKTDSTGDLHIICLTDKTVVLDEVVYDDLRITPGAFDRPGVSDPTIIPYDVNAGGISTYLWEFKKNDIASFSVQLPHSYKQGENISVHIHWTPGPRGNEENGATVGWKIDYAWANINLSFPTMSTADLSDACDGTDHKHQITPDITIIGSSKNVSSILLCNVKRTDTGADDTWASTTSGQLPLLLEIDFHFPIDTIGSRQPSAK